MSLKDTHKLAATLNDVSSSDDDIIKKFSKPMRKRIDIEELKREQNFKPINKEVFFKKIEELNIEEPLEDLLRMI